MKNSTRKVLLTTDICVIAVGAILTVALGIVWFARGIEVDAAGTTGYATALENTMFYTGMALVVIGVVSILILSRTRRQSA